MFDGLRKNIGANARRKKLGANARLMALDALRTNVMVADNDLRITYMNPAVMALMREAEADLKQELPRFSTDRLIGTSIDDFHKNPPYQRKMLATLDRPHNAMIRVGARVFDLLVTPLIEDGKRNGFVVEWADAKERLLNLDYASQIAAISKTQAMISFALDGTVQTANARFLEAMGYTFDEIKGRNHAMFVDPAYRDSAEYRAFWAALNHGDYQAAQVKRIGKGGREVWIEATYNPILDLHGKPSRVVKFAIDVTAQIENLANLKRLIDHNFHEIDQAIARTSSQAGLAAGSVQTTTGTVQTLAASAEQLAASVREIAGTMMQAKLATDTAASQAESASDATRRLAETSASMGGIVAVIRNIAGQINLLALNATIESARAGEAGRGFAVVAGEVKSLARQAADATARIGTEIERLQVVSAEVVTALETINHSIESVRQFAAGTASAVEQQSAVTQQMSSGMQTTATSVQAINDNMTEIAAAVTQVADALGNTRQAATVLVR